MGSAKSLDKHMKLHLWRSILLLLTLVFLILWLGQKLGHRDGLIIATAMALSIIGLIFWYGDWRLLPKFKVTELEGQDPWGLRVTLQDLSNKARTPMPRIYIVPSEAPQALAVGHSLSASKVFLTEGLLEQLSPEELKAVLAYNLICIKNRNTLSFTVASALAEVLLSLSSFLDWSLIWLFGSKKSSQQPRVRLATWTVAPLAATAVRLAVGRQPYLRADKDAAVLLGDSKILARVLWKLESYALTQPFYAAPAMSHFFIVNPLTANRFGRYFHAHPEIQERIKNLVGHYPI